MSDTNVNGKHRTPRLHSHTDQHWRAVLVGDKQRAPTIADVQSYLLQVCDGNTTATGLITGNKAHVDHKLHGLHDQLTAVGFYILTNDVVFRNAIIGKNNDSFSMYLQPTTKYVDDVTFNSALKDAVDRYNQQRDSAPSTAPETNAGSTGAQATPVIRCALRSGTQSDARKQERLRRRRRRRHGRRQRHRRPRLGTVRYGDPSIGSVRQPVRSNHFRRRTAFLP